MESTRHSLPKSSCRSDLAPPTGWVTWLPKWILEPIHRPKVFQVFEPCPAYHQASVRAWYLAVSSGSLGRDIKEAIAVAVSAANKCPY